MALELASAPATADAPPPEGEQKPAGTPPVSADARQKAAERARKHRALKKLKAAKSERQLKEVAAEVASEPDAERAASWPSGEEIGKAAAQLAPMLEQAMELLKGTPWELSEKKAQILLMGLSPAAAQAAKDPGTSSIAKYVSPGVVALGTVALVLGPPTIREIRALVQGTPPPAPTPQVDPVQGAK